MKLSEDFKNHLFLKLEKLISYVFYYFVMKFSEAFIKSSFEIGIIDFLRILSFCDEI